MSEFTPIPGVWYIDPVEDVWYLYAPPRPEDGNPSYPWWSNDTQAWETNVPVDRLEVMFNPHPPTRTELAVQTLTELQTWLEKQRNERMLWSSKLRAKGETESGERWGREAVMAQETLDWLEAKRSGNG